MRFATRRVAGWNDRHVNMTLVAERLYARRRDGYTLQPDETKFLGDFESLNALYNTPKKNSALVTLTDEELNKVIDSINSPEDLYKALYD